MNEHFEIARTGVVVAYDADTGETLIVNEIFEEVTAEQTDYSKAPTDNDCDALKEEARRSYGSRKIDVIAASNNDLAISEEVPVMWQVDLQSRKLVQNENPDVFALRSK